MGVQDQQKAVLSYFLLVRGTGAEGEIVKHRVKEPLGARLAFFSEDLPSVHQIFSQEDSLCCTLS